MKGATAQGPPQRPVRQPERRAWPARRPLRGAEWSGSWVP